MKRVALVLAMFLSGVAVSQIYSADVLNVRGLALTKPDELDAAALNILNAYSYEPYGGRSEGQVAQNASEASVALQYIQIKQNQEIIRLLTQLAAK